MGKAIAAARAVLPIPNNACGIFMCQNKDMSANDWDFNVHTDINACNCTQGLYGHWKRVCTESWLHKKIPCHTISPDVIPCGWLGLKHQPTNLPHQGIKTASVVCWSDTLATELQPHTYLLSCVLFSDESFAANFAVNMFTWNSTSCSHQLSFIKNCCQVMQKFSLFRGVLGGGGESCNFSICLWFLHVWILWGHSKTTSPSFLHYMEKKHFLSQMKITGW